MNNTPAEIIKVTISAFDQMMEFASKNPSREVLGVFFGDISNDGIVFVKEAYNFRVGGKIEVSFQDEDYERVYPIIKDSQKRKLEWLGWFHSHPFAGGDHLYMSTTDIRYQLPAQTQNPFWTAIILNPHQKNDPTTMNGARAFRLIAKESRGRITITKKVKTLQISLVN
ncbi:MAG: Mov34/MPN/PAD-1 family protein [Promethearchaeota archaeon]